MYRFQQELPNRRTAAAGLRDAPEKIDKLARAMETEIDRRAMGN